jgi:hypothetical protein
MTERTKRQADGNPYPDRWKSSELGRLRRFIEDELVLSWYTRRTLLAMVRAVELESQERDA